MEKITAIIVDDEKLALNRLTDLVQRFDHIDRVLFTGPVCLSLQADDRVVCAVHPPMVHQDGHSPSDVRRREVDARLRHARAEETSRGESAR